MSTLSAFELSSPRFLPRLVPHVDQLGYRRFWTTEHYSADQSSAPEIACAIALSLSERIEVGSAGVMLRYVSPLRLAAQFRLLAGLYPGRVNLGTIGGGAPTKELHLALLDGRTGESPSYADRFADLAMLLRDRADATTPARSTIFHSDSSATLWMCSNRLDSAVAAARLGAGLVVNLHLSQLAFDPMLRETIERYSCERPDGVGGKAVLVCSGVCVAPEVSPGERDVSVARFAGSNLSFVGEPAVCIEQLQAVMEFYRVSDIAVQCLAPSLAEKCYAYERLAFANGQA